MIDITGANLRTAISKAYELSTPQGLGLLHFQDGVLSESNIDSILARGTGCKPVSMDYVNGRSCKFHVRAIGGKLSIPDYWYDHSSEQLDLLLQAIGISRTISA